MLRSSMSLQYYGQYTHDRNAIDGLQAYLKEQAYFNDAGQLDSPDLMLTSHCLLHRLFRLWSPRQSDCWSWQNPPLMICLTWPPQMSSPQQTA